MMPQETPVNQEILKKQINIAVGTSRTATKWRNETISIKDFLSRLKKPTVCQHSMEEFLAMPRNQQMDKKDHGGYVGGFLKDNRRGRANIQSRFFISLDLDHPKKADQEKVVQRIQQNIPYAWVLHSTHKHTPEKPRVRLIIFLDRAVFADEYEALARKLAEKIDIEWFDDTTYEPHRLMYWASIPNDVDYLFEYNLDKDVSLLPANEVLAEYGPDGAWKDASFWPVSSRQATALQKKAQKQEDPTSKKGTVGAFCRTFTIKQAIENFLADVYKHEGHGRYTYMDGSSTKGLVIYEDKFAYSNHATDPSANRLCNAFDLVRIHKFADQDEGALPDTPVNKLPSYQMMVEFADEMAEVKKEKIQYMLDSAKDISSKGESEGEDEKAWLSKLAVSQNGAIKPTFGNVTEIMNHDDYLKNLIWYNEFTDTKEKGRGGPEWTAEDTLNVRKYLQEQYSMDVSGTVAADSVEWKADKRRHHPVREYLSDLQGKWDGKKRVETLWIDYLGEEDNAYTRETARAFCLAAVTRIFHKGYKFDYVPIIAGPQGIRKSTMCQILAIKPEWFGELATFDEQKAVEQMKGKWILELAELSVNNRNELEQQKYFLSSTKITVRLAYRRDSATFHRHCVFIGSTNQKEYLKDTTGNRRWWPLDCSGKYRETGPHLDVEVLRDNVDQIWAEAMEIYCDMDSDTELTQEAVKIAMRRQTNKLESDEWEGVIESWIKQTAHKKRYERGWDNVYACLPDDDQNMEARGRVCLPEIWTDCLQIKQPMKKHDKTRLAAIMDRMEGWERRSSVRFGDRFGRQKGWIRDPGEAPF